MLYSCWLWHNRRHQHHLFWKRQFLPRSARVRCLPRNKAFPKILEHHPLRQQTEQSHAITYQIQFNLRPCDKTCHQNGRQLPEPSPTELQLTPPQHRKAHSFSPTFSRQDVINQFYCFYMQIDWWLQPRAVFGQISSVICHTYGQFNGKIIEIGVIIFYILHKTINIIYKFNLN